MKRKGNGFLRRLALTLAVFAAVMACGCALVGWIGCASEDSERELVQDAVRSAMLTCYAVEGAYPLSIDYLKDYYGLRYNEDAYYVVYDAFASNVMPGVQVLPVGGDGL